MIVDSLLSNLSAKSKTEKVIDSVANMQKQRWIEGVLRLKLLKENSEPSATRMLKTEQATKGIYVRSKEKIIQEMSR